MCDRIAIIQHGKLVDVQKLNDAESIISFRFEVSNVSAAAALLDQETGFDYRAGANYIDVEAHRDEIPRINRIFALANIDVYKVTAQTHTLEDRFLEITREG